MAELGIAGSAVGLASLGIEVCQGLLGYYQDWKGYREDVDSTYSKISSLQQTLELLACVLKDGSIAAEHAARANECLIECCDGIENLKKRLAKIRKNDDPRGFRQVVRAGEIRLLYPFKKDTLTKLDNLVTDLIMRLSLVLDMLHLKTHLNSCEVVRNVEDATAKLETFTLDIKNVALRMERCAELERLRSWLSAPDAYTNHEDARSRHEPGTQLIFLDSIEFASWVAGRIRVLSLVGKAGCCKTILISTMIEEMLDHTAREPDHAVAFFYFAFSDQRKQSYRNMLLSIIHQLADYPHVHAILKSAMKSGMPLSVGLLEECIRSLASDVGRISLMIDALDEIPTTRATQEVVEGLTRLLHAVPELSILTTSRPEQDILDMLEQANSTTMLLDPASINLDIAVYVREQIKRCRNLRQLSPSLQEKVITTLGRRSDGM
jgi:hypothetical protein